MDSRIGATPESGVGDAVEPSEVAGELGFQGTTSWLLAGAGKLVLQRWGVMLADLELTSSQYKLLLALNELGPLGQQRLAELVGIDPRNTVPIIETLVEQGLLIRTIDPTDRRRRVLELSSTGQRYAAQLELTSAEIETELLSPLNLADQASLRRLLHSVLDASESHP
ncbi:MarR family winged helix-turn-helix transcriptional regulator [Pseudonocardia spinosispora]|uniref:MarR family winged helix-turn-helix transcriptional regulator n=1 Tax=Pseudonocardia spinosispora TaxID=103441 RepID=UPI00040750F9|nr:MarR family winged helix-turn-helix transcriptional regulator [Pseudonocardia spinosispora]